MSLCAWPTDALTEIKASIDLAVPTLPQAALARFIANGSLDRHTRRTRSVYRRRRDALVDAVHSCAPELDLAGIRRRSTCPDPRRPRRRRGRSRRARSRARPGRATAGTVPASARTGEPRAARTGRRLRPPPTTPTAADGRRPARSVGPHLRWAGLAVLVAVITSAANPLVKRIRKLRDRRARQAERAFYVEGVQPVWRAHDAGADIEVLVVSPELISGGPAGPLVDGFVRAGGALVEVSRDVFAAMSERDGPAGVAAVVRLPVTSLSDIAVHPGAVVVGLHDVANPGNLGTIVRTADAFGAAGVVLIGDTADAYSPAAVKASMGSLFALPVVTVGAVGEAFEWATGAQLSVVTTSARGAIAVPRAVVPKPSLVVFGNEGAGLPPDVIAAGALDLRIPMRGSASSLNLAVAAGIVLYLATA